MLNIWLNSEKALMDSNRVYKFHFDNEVLEYQGSYLQYNEILKIFNSVAELSFDDFTDTYENYKNFDTLIDNIIDTIYELINNYTLPMAIKTCTTFKKYDLSSEDIFQLFKSNSCFEEIDAVIQHLYDIYNTIEEELHSEEERRAYRKANRDQFIGGGFGMSGAIKGTVKAGALNATTGIAHSVFNAIGNSIDRSNARQKKAEIYNASETMEAFKSAINSLNTRAAMILASEVLSLPIIYNNSDIYKKAKSIKSNISNGLIPTADAKAYILKMLQTNPLDYDLYNEFENYFSEKEKSELDKMEELFNINSVYSSSIVYVQYWINDLINAEYAESDLTYVAEQTLLVKALEDLIPESQYELGIRWYQDVPVEWHLREDNIAYWLIKESADQDYEDAMLKLIELEIEHFSNTSEEIEFIDRYLENCAKLGSRKGFLLAIEWYQKLYNEYQNNNAQEQLKYILDIGKQNNCSGAALAMALYEINRNEGDELSFFRFLTAVEQLKQDNIPEIEDILSELKDLELDLTYLERPEGLLKLSMHYNNGLKAKNFEITKDKTGDEVKRILLKAVGYKSAKAARLLAEIYWGTTTIYIFSKNSRNFILGLQHMITAASLGDEHARNMVEAISIQVVGTPDGLHNKVKNGDLIISQEEYYKFGLLLYNDEIPFYETTLSDIEECLLHAGGNANNRDAIFLLSEVYSKYNRLKQAIEVLLPLVELDDLEALNKINTFNFRAYLNEKLTLDINMKLAKNDNIDAIKFLANYYYNKDISKSISYMKQGSSDIELEVMAAGESLFLGEDIEKNQQILDKYYSDNLLAQTYYWVLYLKSIQDINDLAIEKILSIFDIFTEYDNNYPYINIELAENDDKSAEISDVDINIAEEQEERVEGANNNESNSKMLQVKLLQSIYNHLRIEEDFVYGKCYLHNEFLKDKKQKYHALEVLQNIADTYNHSLAKEYLDSNPILLQHQKEIAKRKKREDFIFGIIFWGIIIGIGYLIYKYIF